MIRGSKIDTILTWLFMVLAVAAVVCYFAFPENRLPFLYCGGAAHQVWQQVLVKTLISRTTPYTMPMEVLLSAASSLAA